MGDMMFMRLFPSRGNVSLVTGAKEYAVRGYAGGCCCSQNMEATPYSVTNNCVYMAVGRLELGGATVDGKSSANTTQRYIDYRGIRLSTTDTKYSS
jgi:hypothetical protein